MQSWNLEFQNKTFSHNEQMAYACKISSAHSAQPAPPTEVGAGPTAADGQRTPVGPLPDYSLSWAGALLWSRRLAILRSFFFFLY